MPANLGGSAGTVPSYVPAANRAGVLAAAGSLGIPASVVAAQIQDESGYNNNAVSPAGALGAAQFLPTTWAGQGCKGSPQNWDAAIACYTKYMGSLLKQYNGNVADALAAYNCGTADCPAGQQYAANILRNAAQPGTLLASGGTGASTGAAAGGSSAALGSICLIGISESGIPGTSWISDIAGTGGNIASGQLCLLRKSSARAVIGGLVVLPALGLVLVGAALLAFQTLKRPLGVVGAGGGMAAEVAGGALALAGAPELGAPIAAAGSGLKRASGRSQGRASSYAQRKRTSRQGDARELEAKGASDVRAARKPRGTLPKPDRPGRPTGRSLPGPRQADDTPPF